MLRIRDSHDGFYVFILDSVGKLDLDGTPNLSETGTDVPQFHATPLLQLMFTLLHFQLPNSSVCCFLLFSRYSELSLHFTCCLGCVCGCHPDSDQDPSSRIALESFLPYPMLYIYINMHNFYKLLPDRETKTEKKGMHREKMQWQWIHSGNWNWSFSLV